MNEADEEQILNLSTGKLLIWSVVSANIYMFISLLIIKYGHEGWLPDIFRSEFSIGLQTGIGIGAGMVAAGIIYMVINLKPFSEILDDFTIFKVLSNAKFSFFDRAQISIFAGAGEELLFRGAIQPLIGNTLTSIIFIGIHGYFRFKSPTHILFGVMMFGLSFMLGLLYQEVGLIAAMTAHAAYDLILLMVIQKKNRE